MTFTLEKVKINSTNRRIMWLVGRSFPGKVYLGIGRRDLLRLLPDVIPFRKDMLDGPLRNPNLLPRAVSLPHPYQKNPQDPKVKN